MSLKVFEILKEKKKCDEEENNVKRKDEFVILMTSLWSPWMNRPLMHETIIRVAEEYKLKGNLLFLSFFECLWSPFNIYFLLYCFFLYYIVFQMMVLLVILFKFLKKYLQKIDFGAIYLVQKANIYYFLFKYVERLLVLTKFELLLS